MPIQCCAKGLAACNAACAFMLIFLLGDTLKIPPHRSQAPPQTKMSDSSVTASLVCDGARGYLHPIKERS